jgi:Predicted acyltransferases
MSLNFTPANKDTRQHSIAALDGVRAFACFSVIAFHINHLTSSTHLWPSAYVGNVVTNLLLSGFSGVTLFFILSGFLLFLTYCRSLLFDAEWPQMWHFYLRRIFRIWPGYFAALFLLVLLAHREYLQSDHLKQLLLFLTFFMDARKSTFQQLNGPFWTLAVEWQFYMLLPLLALGMRWIVQRGSLQRRLLVLLLCLSGLLLWGLLTRWWGDSWERGPQRVPLLPARVHEILLFFLYGQSGKYLEDFALGMIICVFYTLVRYKPEHALGSVLTRYSNVFWYLGLLCLFFAATWSLSAVHTVFEPLFSFGRSLSELPFSSGYGLCVLGILFGARQITWFWRWRPIRWFGTLSYGLYIWHLPFIFVFSSLVVPQLRVLHGLWIYGLFWLWVMITVIPFCFLFYRLVEVPWIAFGSRIVHKGE